MVTNGSVSLPDALLELIRGRRSVRKFLDDDVPDDDILRIIEAARLAPSGGNQQPWRFLIVRNKDVLNEMKLAMLEVREEMLRWPEAKGYEARVNDLRRMAGILAGAPVVIVVLTEEYGAAIDRKVLPARGYSFEEIHRLRADPGLQSVGAAIENIQLMACALGYGSCWMTSPLYAGPALERILDVHDPWRLAAAIPIGVAAESPRRRPRKTLEEIATFIR